MYFDVEIAPHPACVASLRQAVPLPRKRGEGHSPGRSLPFPQRSWDTRIAWEKGLGDEGQVHNTLYTANIGTILFPFGGKNLCIALFADDNRDRFRRQIVYTGMEFDLACRAPRLDIDCALSAEQHQRILADKRCIPFERKFGD